METRYAPLWYACFACFDVGSETVPKSKKREASAVPIAIEENSGKDDFRATWEDEYRNISEPLEEAFSGRRADSVSLVETIIRKRVASLGPVACAMLLFRTCEDVAEAAFERLKETAETVPEECRAELFAHALGNSMLDETSAGKLASMLASATDADEVVQYVYRARGEMLPEDAYVFPPDVEDILVGIILSRSGSNVFPARVATLFGAVQRTSGECFMSVRNIDALIDAFLGFEFPSAEEKIQKLGELLRKTPSVVSSVRIVFEIEKAADSPELALSALEAVSSAGTRRLRRNSLSFGDTTVFLEAATRLASKCEEYEEYGSGEEDASITAKEMGHLVLAVLSLTKFATEPGCLASVLRALALCAPGFFKKLDEAFFSSAKECVGEILVGALKKLGEADETWKPGEMPDEESLADAVVRFCGSPVCAEMLGTCAGSHDGERIRNLVLDLSSRTAGLLAAKDARDEENDMVVL